MIFGFFRGHSVSALEAQKQKITDLVTKHAHEIEQAVADRLALIGEARAEIDKLNTLVHKIV